MSKSIFISCVYEDSYRIDSVKKWADEKRLGDVVITQEIEDKRSQGKEAIKQHIKNKIRGAAIVLVLIGQDTHNHEWIEAELELANSFNVGVICVRIPNTTGAVPPLLRNHKLIAFNPDLIKALI
ncbi:MAG TPA: TIR domain-containing protein [Bacteroidia bacterium]|nr:TIR domain-containing protein [Bacteroidia bacterium]